MKELLKRIVGVARTTDETKIAQIEHDLIMPKYQYSSPIDYSTESWPPAYEPTILVPGVELPVPPAKARPGYSPDDDKFYLEWGALDHDWIMSLIERYHGVSRGMSILDWGCASGRVLRHFYSEHKSLGWRLHGIDVQGYLVEWMRQNFPPEIEVLTGTTFPHLPYKDETFDVVYGISVFTHTKYLWDSWLAEMKRVLKPGGLCIQTVQCEDAWRFYHQHRHVDWVRNGHPDAMLCEPEMTADFFFYGDGHISQTFFKEEVIKRYWGRIMEVVAFLPPQKLGYQNWIVAKA